MITKLIERAADDAWIRTCAECGHQQVSKKNPEEFKDGLPESYRNAKCRKCKSEALDFGTSNASCDDWMTDDQTTLEV
jgi:hypothetical protein